MKYNDNNNDNKANLLLLRLITKIQILPPLFYIYIRPKNISMICLLSRQNRVE